MPTPRIEFKQVPRWRIAVASPNSVRCVVDGIEALDRPEHFEVHASWLATPANYAEGAFEVETRLKPSRMTERRCAETILDRRSPVTVKIFRLGASFGLFGNALTRGVIPKFSPAELVATAPGSKKGDARVVTSILGFVDSPDGLIAVDVASPGFWPEEPMRRLGLTLNWIMRARHGERMRWRLVRP